MPSVFIKQEDVEGHKAFVTNEDIKRLKTLVLVQSKRSLYKITLLIVHVDIRFFRCDRNQIVPTKDLWRADLITLYKLFFRKLL